MNESDIEKIFLEIVTATSAENPAFMNWSVESIHQAIQNSHFRFLRSEQDEIVAFICFQRNSEFAEILALGTRQQFQRQGYSEKLLLQFSQECSGTSKLLTLEVHCKNERAIALYEKCGFKTVRIRKNYYSDGSDALVMDCGLISAPSK